MNMFFNIIIFITIVFSTQLGYSQISSSDPIEVSVGATKNAKIKLLIGIVGHKNNHLEHIARRIEQNCIFSGQFDVGHAHVSECKNKKKFEKTLHQFFENGYSLGLFLSDDTQGSGIVWRIYDIEKKTMAQGKVYEKRGKNPTGWAHNISDTVWPLLTGIPGSFSTKIAFCKAVPFGGNSGKKKSHVKKGHMGKHIFIADYDGSHQEPFVESGTVNIAPRWTGKSHQPLLYFSEHTDSNVRLIQATMDKKRRIASSFDGTTMLPSFSHDGSRVVYCASRGSGSTHMYYQTQNAFRRLTHNNANNVSPVFAHNDSKVYFCSDVIEDQPTQVGVPYLYCYDLITHKQEQIVTKGYCASPSYCQYTNKLAYVKNVNQISQVFVYDPEKKTEQQITFDPTRKEECSWSPCGSYLLYAVTQGNSSRIAVYNFLTQTQKFITAAHEQCSYPHWSPVYDQVPYLSV